MTVVTSVAIAEAELPPDTLTWFVRLEGAVEATLTVTVMAGKLAPAPSRSLRVHVFVEQVHPVPVMETSVRPVGMVSVTVTVPLLTPAELPLLTVAV